MTDHLSLEARRRLEDPAKTRIASIRAPRWIGHPVAEAAHERLRALLGRAPSLRTQGLMLVGPYANGKTMIVERFAVRHLDDGGRQRVWIVQTREGAGLAHFYASILEAMRAPERRGRDVRRAGEQVDRLLEARRPRLLVFDEFHNALRGRRRDIEAVFAFLRRIGRQYDVSPILVGEPEVFDHVTATEEMSTRIDLMAVPRWRYDEDYLTLLDSLEAALPLRHPSGLSDEAIARPVHRLSEGLIGEIVAIVTRAAEGAVTSGTERITPAALDELDYVPVSRRSRTALRDALL